jgi:hypothetical protein
MQTPDSYVPTYADAGMNGLLFVGESQESMKESVDGK